MFDVIAVKPIEITGVQVAFEENPLTSTIDVFSKLGTHVGFEANAAAWTLAVSGPVTVSALATPSPVLNFTTPIPVAAGERRAFYINRDAGAGPNLNTSNGVGGGVVTALDANLLIFEGTEIDGVFGGVAVLNRIPNMTIHYEFQAGNSPTVDIIGPNRITTSESRVTIFGLALDDGAVDSVKMRFKKARANGSLRSVNRTLTPDENGLFRGGVKTFIGRNPVTFQATDNKGQKSAKKKVVITGVVVAL